MFGRWEPSGAITALFDTATDEEVDRRMREEVCVTQIEVAIA